jgi:hypothetical protein
MHAISPNAPASIPVGEFSGKEESSASPISPAVEHRRVDEEVIEQWIN